MREVLRAACCVAGAVSWIAACAATRPTSITIDVRTDLACADLKSVVIAVAAPTEVDATPAQTLTAACSPLDGTTSSIGTLVIVPSGAKDAEIGVRVVGGVDKLADRCTSETRFQGCIVARRIARFVTDAEITLTVDLRRSCADVACDVQSTCAGASCKPAVVDTSRCVDAPCGEDVLGGGVTPTDDGGPGPTSVPDGGSKADAGDAGPPCAPDEKRCGDVCVKISNAAYGCTATGCAPCAGSDSTEFSCASEQCERASCKQGFKLCGGVCVAADAAHGCNNATCTPCASANGQAGCGPAGCTIKCGAGAKLCGGVCVRVDDPTFGCTDTGCTATNCPDPGSGTLVCTGATCAVGPCPAGTKSCGTRCVPTDANNGCESASCAACKPGEICGGTPSACQCVPEAPSVTCASKACGTATNNCGQVVQCPDTCSQIGPLWKCGGSGAGPSSCGCVPYDQATACQGLRCGPAADGCGHNYSCGTCSYPLVCKCEGVCLGAKMECP